MPEGLARMNNLPDVPGRADSIGDVIIEQGKKKLHYWNGTQVEISWCAIL